MKAKDKEHNKTVTILFAHFGGDLILGSERCLLDLLRHLDRRRFKAVVWCNSGIMAAEVRRLNIEVVQADFPRLFKLQHYRSPISKYFTKVRNAIELIDQHDIKLIHANSSIPTQFLNFVARARHVPLISHLHSRNTMRDRVSNGLHQVAMAVGVSQPVIDQLIADGMRSEQTCVIPNGIDTENFMLQPTVNIREQLKYDESDLLIATTGSLIHRKGTDIIIEAISRLHQKSIPARLIIIGKGPDQYELEQQVQRLGIQDSVTFLGERNDVSGLLRGGVDLYVSAAREEAFGLALAEASLAGLAVVAPDTGGVTGVILDGRTGSIFPAGDVSALSDAVIDLYQSPELRNQLGEAGRRHVYDKLTIQHNVDHFQRLYTSVLNDPSMYMHWHSHWQWRGTFTKILKQLIDIARTKFYRVANI